MANYKIPDPSSPGGYPVAKLLDKVIAVWPLGEEDYDTKHGKRAGHKAQVFELDINGNILADIVDRGEVIFFQEVLIDKLRFHNCDDGWLIAHLIKPRQAYLFVPPTENVLPAVAKAADMLDDLWQPPATAPAIRPEPEPEPDPEPDEDEAF